MTETEKKISEIEETRTQISFQISDFYLEAEKRELSNIEKAVLNEIVREYQKLTDEIEKLNPTPKRFTPSELIKEVKRTGKSPMEIIEDFKNKK